MKVTITLEEWYPVIELNQETSDWGKTIDIPAELAHKYEANLLEFKDIQKQLNELQKAQ